MKFALLVYQSDAAILNMSEDELAREMESCGRWVEELEKQGKHVFSAGLRSPQGGRTIRNGAVVGQTDGPFTETKEYLGGLTIIEATDMEEALTIAEGFPPSKIGSVQVRALFEGEPGGNCEVDRKIADTYQRLVAASAG